MTFGWLTNEEERVMLSHICLYLQQMLVYIAYNIIFLNRLFTSDFIASVIAATATSFHRTGAIIVAIRVQRIVCLWLDDLRQKSGARIRRRQETLGVLLLLLLLLQKRIPSDRGRSTKHTWRHQRWERRFDCIELGGRRRRRSVANGVHLLIGRRTAGGYAANRAGQHRLHGLDDITAILLQEAFDFVATTRGKHSVKWEKKGRVGTGNSSRYGAFEQHSPQQHINRRPLMGGRRHRGGHKLMGGCRMMMIRQKTRTNAASAAALRLSDMPQQTQTVGRRSGHTVQMLWRLLNGGQLLLLVLVLMRRQWRRRRRAVLLLQAEILGCGIIGRRVNVQIGLGRAGRTGARRRREHVMGQWIGGRVLEQARTAGRRFGAGVVVGVVREALTFWT